MQDEKNLGDQNSDEKKDKVIPIQKAYIWGIIFCVVALVSVVLYNNIKKPHPLVEKQMDYLALLRDQHKKVVSGQGIVRIEKMTIGELESVIRQESGRNVVFPDWLGDIQMHEVVGAASTQIGEDSAISLVIRASNNTINFITIFNTRPEIDELESVMLEDHEFHKYSWANYYGYFWQISEDKLPITYGIIGDAEPVELEMLAIDTMRSLKTMYSHE